MRATLPPAAGGFDAELTGGELGRVADARDGANQRSVLSKLRAEPSDVDVDRSGFSEIAETPDLVEELLAGEDLPGALEEMLEEPVLRRRQVNFLLAEE